LVEFAFLDQVEIRYFRFDELPDGVFAVYNGKPYLVYGSKIFE